MNANIEVSEPNFSGSGFPISIQYGGATGNAASIAGSILLDARMELRSGYVIIMWMSQVFHERWRPGNQTL